MGHGEWAVITVAARLQGPSAKGGNAAPQQADTASARAGMAAKLAAHLQSGGVPGVDPSLRVYNRTADKARAFAAEPQLGATAVASPADLAACSITFVMLAEDKAVEQVQAVLQCRNKKTQAWSVTTSSQGLGRQLAGFASPGLQPVIGALAQLQPRFHSRTVMRRRSVPVPTRAPSRTLLHPSDAPLLPGGAGRGCRPSRLCGLQHGAALHHPAPGGGGGKARRDVLHMPRVWQVRRTAGRGPGRGALWCARVQRAGRLRWTAFARQGGWMRSRKHPALPCFATLGMGILKRRTPPPPPPSHQQLSLCRLNPPPPPPPRPLLALFIAGPTPLRRGCSKPW